MLSLGPGEKINECITLSSRVSTSNTIKWTGWYISISIGTSCGERENQQLSFKFIIQCWSKFFSSVKKNVRLEEMLEFVEKICSAFFFSCSSWTVIKIFSFGSYMRNTKCLHTLITWYPYPNKKKKKKKKLRHSHVSGYGPNWLAGIVVNYSLDLTNNLWNSFLIRTQLPSCRTFVINIELVQLFLNRLHCPHIFSQTLKTSYWNFRCECQVVQYAVAKFLEEWITPWCFFSQLTLIYCTVDKTWKNTKCTQEIIYLKRRQFTNRTFIYIYII